MHTVVQAVSYILLNWRVSKWWKRNNCNFQPCKFNSSYLVLLPSINLSLKKRTYCELIILPDERHVLTGYTVSLVKRTRIHVFLILRSAKFCKKRTRSMSLVFSYLCETLWPPPIPLLYEIRYCAIPVSPLCGMRGTLFIYRYS